MERDRWLVGAAAGATQSTLRFTGELDLELTQYAVMANAGYARPSRVSFRAAVGAILGGALEREGRTHDLGPGIVGAVSVAKQWVSGAWFVTGTLGFSASRTTTTEALPGAPTESLVATDLRLGVMAGRSFGALSPYVLARGFGGPVFWTLDATSVRGTDTHHFQLGAGASVATARGISILVDVSVLGERSASLGLSLPL